MYEKVAEKLKSLVPGRYIDTHKVPEAQRADYIEAVKRYIDEVDNGIEFTNDYRYVRRFYKTYTDIWDYYLSLGAKINESGYKRLEMRLNGKLIGIKIL